MCWPCAALPRASRARTRAAWYRLRTERRFPSSPGPAEPNCPHAFPFAIPFPFAAAALASPPRHQPPASPWSPEPIRPPARLNGPVRATGPAGQLLLPRAVQHNGQRWSLRHPSSPQEACTCGPCSVARAASHLASARRPSPVPFLRLRLPTVPSPPLCHRPSPLAPSPPPTVPSPPPAFVLRWPPSPSLAASCASCHAQPCARDPLLCGAPVPRLWRAPGRCSVRYGMVCSSRVLCPCLREARMCAG